MLQKCSLWKVLSVFFKEPTSIHFIKEIGKEIDLAPTSVRNHIKELLKENLIERKKAAPFDGFVANRENPDFVYYKRIYNLYSLKDLREFIISECYPKAIILFGSYSLGEDVESSDIDIALLSKTKKMIDVKKYEKGLGRIVNIMFIKRLNDLDSSIQKKVINGIILHGGI